MVAHLLDKTIAKLIELGSIKEDEKDLYAYGLQQGLIIILNILTTVAIGLFSGMFWQSILFMAAYLPLRSFAGGYHANTQLLCYLYSIILTSTVLMAIKLIPWTNPMCLGLALFAGVIIFILGPVEDSNKPLDQIEIATYRKRTRAILLVELVIILFILEIGQNNILPGMSVSLFALSVMLVLGKVKNYNNQSII
ncbi:accessory gene regulator B [Paenibacillus sp. DS2015]|uniref:accessory gene regulator ArgB-like protein n=1 Tax=Paenibacillus sp. DS2015 TaxID=3373917 RepID=UPI003D254911